MESWPEIPEIWLELIDFDDEIEVTQEADRSLKCIPFEIISTRR